MIEEAEDTQQSSLRTVGRNTGILFGSQTITWAIATAVTAIVPRYLGPVAMGEFAVANSLWAIAVVFVGFGTARLITLEAAREPRLAGSLIGPGLRVRALCGALAFAGVALFCWIVGYSDEIFIVSMIAGGAALILAVGELVRGSLLGIERAGAIARADIVAKIVGSAAIVAALLATRNLYVVAASVGVGVLVSTVMMLRSLSQSVPVTYRSTWQETTSMARNGRIFLFAGIALIAYQQVDTIVMSMLVDEEQIGWYGTADSLFGALLFAPAILTMALLPALAREHSVDPAKAHDMLGKAFDLLLVIAIPVGLLTVEIADPFVNLLYGKEFDEAGEVLAIFGVVLLFTFFSVLFGTYATATGQQRLWNLVLVVAVFGTIGLDLVLVPWTDDRYDNGAIGGALSFLITEGAMVGIGLWRVAPGLLTARRLLRVAKCITAGGVLALAIWLVGDLYFVLSAIIGAVAYLAALFALRILDENEIDALKDIGRMRRGG
jgi:O-antigen/teichoic acid export membrane protein